MRFLFVLVLLSLGGNLFAQQLGNYKPQGIDDFFSTDLDSFGEMVVPIIVLPGFLDNDPGDSIVNETYPAYNRILNEDQSITLNNRDLKQIQLVQRTPEEEVVSSYVDSVVILSADISDNKHYEIKDVNLSFVAINDDVEITKVTINGEELQITPSNIVEFSKAVRFDDDDNRILIEGELKDSNRFRKEYNVTYSEKKKETPTFSEILLTASIGHNDNLTNAPVSAYGIGDVSEDTLSLSEQRRQGLYRQVGAIYISYRGKEFLWYGGLYVKRFSDRVTHQTLDTDIAHGGIVWTSGPINIFASASAYAANLEGVLDDNNAVAAEAITEPGRGIYYMLNSDFRYDLNYSKDAHSGFLIGFNPVYRTLPNDKLAREMSVYLRYNKLYLFDWLSTTRLELRGGNGDFSLPTSSHNYVKFSVFSEVFKSDWLLDVGLDITAKNYKEREGVVNTSGGIIDYRPLKSDTIFKYYTKYVYHITNQLDVFYEWSRTSVYSNVRPTDKILHLLGVDYVY